MKLAIFAYSRQGCTTARRLRDLFPGEDCRCYTLEKFEQQDFLPIEKPGNLFYGNLFREMDALLFVGSCGIAVRNIAPHVKDKRTDPAVLCIDERGTYVIPLLSGHIGGANALARRAAEKLGAVAVVTTATDINGKFSVDTWASTHGCRISSMAAAKAVSARILEQDIPLLSHFPIKTELPPGVVRGDAGDLGILISWQTATPFAETLRLIPRVVHLGIGCRKGISREAVEHAVFQVLEENHIDRQAVKQAASIDLKAGEQGLLQFCRDENIPITFYTAGELKAVPGEFTASQFVSSITGVENVCERSAMLGADRLIVKKTACNGVTVAAAVENWEVYFG